MEYSVKLSSFEGPLDLLLFLLRKNEVDIYDIPISVVVKQYIEYLGGLEELSIDRAGEYLLMLATLMRIKSRMLLPGDELEDEDNIEDPREELVNKLIEYQKFKEIAGDLSEKAEMRSLLFNRGTANASFEGFQVEPPELDVEIDTLIAAFRQAMQKFSEQEQYVPEMAQFTVEDKMSFLSENLSHKESLHLEDLFAACKSKLELIVLFLALLEMMRLRKLKVRQSSTFGALAVYRVSDEEDSTESTEEASP
jgi:segregation and condensation protein A